MTAQAFLNGTGTHPCGLTRQDVTELSVERYEDCSLSVSQWMFPTNEKSRFTSIDTVLTDANIHAIRADPLAQSGLLKNLGFYLGVLNQNRDMWLRESDHNHLRITRAIKSVSLLNGYRSAEAFCRYVVFADNLMGNPVNEKSVAFWHDAVQFGEDYDGFRRLEFRVEGDLSS